MTRFHVLRIADYDRRFTAETIPRVASFGGGPWPAILQILTMIRPAVPEDIPAVIDLIHANNDHLLERSREEVETLLPTFWVAELDGEIVGCCCLEIYSKKIAEVRSLVVKETIRRRGIGRALVIEAVREARRRNIAEILTVTSELDFFRDLNFRTCLNEKYALFWHDSSAPEASPSPSQEEHKKP